MSRRRVAILGAGQSALTTALQLTDPDNPDPAEVTIYQLGWRLGGKGATGRPDDGPPRIFEHGLHEWFGFYENSFRQIREVYAELDRPPGAPLATWEEAFVGTDTGFLVEWCEGRPLLWRTTYATHPGQPGDGETPFEHGEHLIRALEHLRSTMAGTRIGRRGPELLAGAGARGVLTATAVLARGLRWRWLEGVLLRVIAALLQVFITVLWLAVRCDITTLKRTPERRLWMKANLGYACAVGAIRDGVFTSGFDVLNDLDLREWLARHAHPDGGVMLTSPLVDAVYQGCFAYPRGDTTSGNMEAGTALRGMVRTLFGYQGSLVYRFAAGTADTAYAPVYEVLRRRGVTFRFFSRVERLQLGADGRVAAVHVVQQAQLKDGEYAPLREIDGLPCWPSEPLWDQLVDGDELRGVDFEWPTPIPGERRVVLEDGRDYDDVVLGISFAALPDLCGELVDRHPAWREAFAAVQTVRTQSLQLWLTEEATQLGFPVDRPQLTPWIYSPASPLNVWGDFSELLPYEHWPSEHAPAGLAYFTATMPEEPQFADQADANRATRAAAETMLTAGLPVILPGVLRGGAFRWDLLIGSGTPGPARLDEQWIRANVLPTERYVLSVAGSTQHRLAVHGQGPANLYLAGDWTLCTLNCGCMEAATISGMLASNALSGFPAREAILGLDF